MKINSEILKRQALLNVVNSKLESDRDVLMDKINTSLYSDNPNRIETIYKSEIKLAQIEKAIEINRMFIVQLQQSAAENFLDSNMSEKDKEIKK